MDANILIGLASFLFTIIGYLLKRILDKVDKIDKIEADVSEMKPKVQIMWEIMISLVQGNRLSDALRDKLKQ